jgi:signal transduction histidine kinase
MSVLLRFWSSTVPELGFFPMPVGLLAGFLVLSLSVPAIAARYPVLIQPWLFLQTALIAVLILTPPLQDYYAALFLSLGLVSTKCLRPGLDLVWLAVFCVVVTAALMLAFGAAEGLAYLPSYLMGILFLDLYGRARRSAEEARAKSEALLGQLHDAATQTVFSITLTAQAARMACDSDPARLPELLDRIQESSADALAEMRILVSELRLRREVLRTIFSIDGEERGTVGLKETLNNVVKHAGVAEAEVVLRVRGAGQGFDGSAASGTGAARGGFGLASMRERVEAGGGTWQIASRPGRGTEITVHMPLPAERERDGQEPAHQSSDR